MQIIGNRQEASRFARQGFTLVELLVVISIIALLIAILLPSLSKARDQAKTVVCATRIKGILSAMSVYAAENSDYIAGSPNTSGSVLFGPQTNNEAGMMERWQWNPVQVWDWGGGLATSMSIKFSTKTHEQRYLEAVRMKAFKCPSNKVLCDAWPEGLDYGNQPMPSYNTSRNFMWPGKKSLLAGSFPDQIGGFGIDPYWSEPGCGWRYDWTQRPGGPMRRVPGDWAEASKPSYLPRVDQIGAPAEKVFIADGGRFVKESQAPQYDAGPFAGFGGAFCDVGAYSYYSRAWNRAAGLPGEAGPSDMQDNRIYSYRHGKKEPYLPVGNYRMNIGFFDNHVETMNDIASANPHFWLPRGFRLYKLDDDVHTDVMETYMQVLETDENGSEYLPIR
jgi:prepilin-type N-terminal cleavage/methylation domain-containing protein/prepilin-type processing-associated H-X9-DG protein